MNTPCTNINYILLNSYINYMHFDRNLYLFIWNMNKGIQINMYNLLPTFSDW